MLLLCHTEPLTHQPASQRAWARAPTAGSRVRAGPVEPPADGGCTWRSASSWRGGNTRSRRSAAWRVMPANKTDTASLNAKDSFRFIYSAKALFVARATTIPLTTVHLNVRYVRRKETILFSRNFSQKSMFRSARSAAFDLSYLYSSSRHFCLFLNITLPIKPFSLK